MATGYEVFSKASGAADTGDQGYQMRMLIPTASLVAAQGGAGLARVTWVTSSGCSVAVLGPAYIGEQAGAGNAWAFDGNQKQLFFNGASATSAFNGAQTIVSDGLTAFAYNPSTVLIVAFYMSGTIYDSLNIPTITGASGYFLAGNTGVGSNDPGAMSLGYSGGITGVTTVEMLPPPIGWGCLPGAGGFGPETWG